MVAKSKSSPRKAASTNKSAKKKTSSVKAAVQAKAKTAVKRAQKKTAKTTTKTVSNAIKATKDKQTSLQIVAQISESIQVDRKDVTAVFLEMKRIIECHIMKRGSGECPLPELGLKVIRHEKPARKARMGRNPATGEPVKVAAKPKQQVVKVKALKKLKEILAA